MSFELVNVYGTDKSIGSQIIPPNFTEQHAAAPIYLTHEVFA
jgi:hypothetical protein